LLKCVFKLWGDILKDTVHIVTTGALLHDIGKLLYRARVVDGRPHSISGAEYIKKFTNEKDVIDCVRFHHRQEISHALLDRDSPAYIVYIADNISSGVDRRETEGETSGGFDRNRPLESVYNLLNNRTGKEAFYPGEIKNTISYPGIIQSSDLSSKYGKVVHDITEGLSGIYFEPEYINSLIELCEAYMSFIPSSTHKGQVADISLFDHSKITAALASCIALYLESNKRNDYRTELFEKEHDFCDEKAFILFSMDISGIQKFIYTISSKGALKGLRSRSFYLEILLENIADEILGVCLLSRANLLYTGGGHAYILLPNTIEARNNVKHSLSKINRKLMERFGTGLFVAYGYEPCSANELMSRTNDPESYINIFRSVSAQISEMKLCRYSPDDIRFLNSNGVDKEGRECVVCGVSSNLIEREDGVMCDTCSALSDVSNALIKDDSVFVVLREQINAPFLPLFSADGDMQFLTPMTADAAKEMLKRNDGKVIRIYSKNAYRTGFSLSTKLWMGDYAAKNQVGTLKTFEQLAECSKGVERIGVLRADVDNLGAAFVSGFIRENEAKDKYKYTTISRTSTLSRSLSLFFKYYINNLMENGEFSLTGKKGERDVVIIYAGGDDLFIVGAWDEVLSAAVDIRRAFSRYTGGALTLSAGFAIYDEKYPISRMAEETKELEERAKNHKYQGKEKNAISLFGLEMEKVHLIDKHTYDWDTFENNVLGEKFALIEKLFTAGGNYGNSFLYNILFLLRQAENEKINIARLAYLLARNEPDRNAPEELKSIYSSFSSNLYKWSINDEDRRQLITALIIYIYTMRSPKEGSNNE